MDCRKLGPELPGGLHFRKIAKDNGCNCPMFRQLRLQTHNGRKLADTAIDWEMHPLVYWGYLFSLGGGSSPSWMFRNPCVTWF